MELTIRLTFRQIRALESILHHLSASYTDSIAPDASHLSDLEDRPMPLFTPDDLDELESILAAVKRPPSE